MTRSTSVDNSRLSTAQLSTVFDGIVKYLKFLGADGQVLTTGKSGKVPPGQVSQTGNGTEALQYFYHPDHLGSTSYVTDATGEVYQHSEYFAFGETFVEEHSNTDRTLYLFNGKEVDALPAVASAKEGGDGVVLLWARYYDARTSQFLGVDPLADKYPMMNPFAYVFNNPLRYVDPPGMEGEDPPAYKVRKGNTLTQIAKDHNTTVDALLKANPNIKNKHRIQAGQTINLPGSGNAKQNQQQAPQVEQCQNCGWNFQLGVDAEATLGWVNFAAEVKHGIGGTFRRDAKVYVLLF